MFESLSELVTERPIGLTLDVIIRLMFELTFGLVFVLVIAIDMAVCLRVDDCVWIRCSCWRLRL